MRAEPGEAVGHARHEHEAGHRDVAHAEQRGGGEHHQRDGGPVGRAPHEQHDRHDDLQQEEPGPAVENDGDCHSMICWRTSMRAEQRTGKMSSTGPSGLSTPSTMPPAGPERGTGARPTRSLAVEPAAEPDAAEGHERRAGTSRGCSPRSRTPGSSQRGSSPSADQQRERRAARGRSAADGAPTPTCPTPSTQPGDHDAAGERSGRPGERATPWRPSTAVVSAHEHPQAGRPRTSCRPSRTAATPASSAPPTARRRR